MNAELQDTEKEDVEGDKLLAKVKEIVHEGNVRRVTISDEEGQNLIEIPLTVGGLVFSSCRSEPRSAPSPQS